MPTVTRIDDVVVPDEGNGAHIRIGDVFAATGAGAGEAAATVAKLAKATLTVSRTAPTGAAAHAVLTGGTSLVVPLAGLVDVERECTRLRGELESLEKQLASLESRLNNEKFVSKAPAEVVAGERKKLGEWSARRQQLREKVQALCGA